MHIAEEIGAGGAGRVEFAPRFSCGAAGSLPRLHRSRFRPWFQPPTPSLDRPLGSAPRHLPQGGAAADGAGAYPAAAVHDRRGAFGRAGCWERSSRAACANGGPSRARPGSASRCTAPGSTGYDDNDRPYTLTAATAQRRRDNASAGRSGESASQGCRLHHRSGARRACGTRRLEVLDLDGDVVMTDAGGYTFTSQKTRMYVRENRVEGQDAAQRLRARWRGPGGFLRGAG